MTEECVNQKKGTYLFCDTDSLAIVSSKHLVDHSASQAVTLAEFCRGQKRRKVVNKFTSLNPYDRTAVKGSILNLVDANFVDSDPTKQQRQLYGYSIAAKRYALYEKTGKSNITIVDPKAHGIGFLYSPHNSPKNWGKDVPRWIYQLWDYIVRCALKMPKKAPSWLDIPQMMRLTITTCNVLEMLGEWKIARPYNFLLLPMVDPVSGVAFHRQSNEKVLLVCAFSSKQEQWFDLDCVNVHDGKKYKMLNCKKTNGNIPYNVVFPSQFAHLLIQYQRHPEAKSLAPDGTSCSGDTRGLLKRAHVVAGEIRYVGKETDRKWEEGDEISVLEFAATEYGRKGKVIANEDVKTKISSIGINKCARESGFDRKNFIREIGSRVAGEACNSYDEFVRWLCTM